MVLRMINISAEIVEKIKRGVLYLVTFIRKTCRLLDKVQKW